MILLHLLASLQLSGAREREIGSTWPIKYIQMHSAKELIMKPIVLYIVTYKMFLSVSDLLLKTDFLDHISSISIWIRPAILITGMHVHVCD